MLTYQDISPNMKAFIFELDDVLYPQQDYLLQVYYLFANFIEFSEPGIHSRELIEFFKTSLEYHGTSGIFERARAAFGINVKYKDNFERLHCAAKLPLKLLIFPNMLRLLQEIVIDRKLIFIVTNGNPEQQLNKIKQVEWNGLENYLTVYFAAEMKSKPATDTFTYILEKYSLLRRDLTIIGNSLSDEEFAISAGVDYITSTDF